MNEHTYEPNKKQQDQRINETISLHQLLLTITTLKILSIDQLLVSIHELKTTLTQQRINFNEMKSILESNIYFIR